MQISPLRPLRGDTVNRHGVSFLFRFFRFREALPFFLMAGGLFPSPTLVPVLAALAALSLLPFRKKLSPPPALLLWSASWALGAAGGGWEGLLRALLALTPLLLMDADSQSCIRAGAIATALAGALAAGEKLLGRAAAEWMDASRFAALGGRAAFPFGNPNLLSAFLLMGLPLCLALQEERPLPGALCALFSLLGILASLSRTAMLGAGALLLFWLFRRAKRPSRAAAVTVMGLSLLPPSLWHRALSVFSRGDTSGLYRLRLWQSLFRLSPQAALLGLGADRGALFSALAPVMSAGLEKAEHTHSLYLGLLFSLGLAGLLSFFLLAGSILAPLFKLKSAAALSLALSLLGALFLGLSDDLFYDRRLFLWFHWLLGLGLSLSKKETSPCFINPVDFSD